YCPLSLLHVLLVVHTAVRHGREGTSEAAYRKSRGRFDMFAFYNIYPMVACVRRPFVGDNWKRRKGFYKCRNCRLFDCGRTKTYISLQLGKDYWNVSNKREFVLPNQFELPRAACDVGSRR